MATKTPLALALIGTSLALLAPTAAAQDLVEGFVVDDGDTYAGVRYRDLDAQTQTQDAFLGARFDDGPNRVEGRVIWAQGANAFTLTYDPVADSLTSVVTNGNGTYTLTYTGVAQRVADQSAFTVEDLNALNINVLERQPGDDVLAVNDLRVNGKRLGSVPSRSSFDEPAAGIANFCFANGFTLSGDLFLDGPFSGGSELSRVEFALGVDGPRGIECVEPSDLALTLAPPADTALPGETRDLLVSVVNNGPFAATGNAIAVTLGEGLTYVDTGACTATDATGRNLDCALVDLAPGADAQITLTVEVDAAAAPAAATVSATAGSTIFDENLADNTDTASILVQAPPPPVPVADIGAALIASPSPANAGESVAYTATLSNAGPDLAANARALVSFDPALAFTFPGSCTVGATLATCPLGDVAAAGSAELAFEAQVPSDASGSVAVTVTVLSDADDANESDNQAQAITAIARVADLGVTLVSGTGTVSVEDAVDFTLTATNAGPSDQPAATISSAISPAIGDLTWTCQAAGGASCPAPSGSGDLSEAVSLPVGGSLVFTLSGTVVDATGNLVSSAAISTADDPDAGNNTAEAVRRGDMLFKDGFELVP